MSRRYPHWRKPKAKKPKRSSPIAKAIEGIVANPANQMIAKTLAELQAEAKVNAKELLEFVSSLKDKPGGK